MVPLCGESSGKDMQTGMEMGEMYISGQFKATSPDLTLNGGYIGNITKIAVTRDLKSF